MSDLWCLIRISDFAVRFVPQLRPRCLLFANIVAFATPKNRVYRHTPLEFGLGVNPRFSSWNRRFAPVADCLDNLTRFSPNSAFPIWRHSVKEVFMSVWISGSCFNVRLFILGWSLLRLSRILLSRWQPSAANPGQTCAWGHAPYSYNH